MTLMMWGCLMISKTMSLMVSQCASGCAARPPQHQSLSSTTGPENEIVVVIRSYLLGAGCWARRQVAGAEAWVITCAIDSSCTS